MYPESCLLLKFHLLPHPSLWGSPTATFQLLEVARFLPALGIILVLPEGSFTVVSLAASSESHSQSYFFSGVPWTWWLKSSTPPHRLSTHAAHIITISHNMLFISFNVRKPKLCLLGTCLSPLLDSELHEEGEDCTYVIHHCNPRAIPAPGVKRCSLCICGWMTRVFWSCHFSWSHIIYSILSASLVITYDPPWLDLTKLCLLVSGIWRIRIRRWPTWSTINNWKKRRMPSYWKKSAGEKIAWLTTRSTCRWALASPVNPQIIRDWLSLKRAPVGKCAQKWRTCPCSESSTNNVLPGNPISLL